MRLVWKEHHLPEKVGEEVKVGDRVMTKRDKEWVEVTYFRRPHSTASEGKISVVFIDGVMAPPLTDEQRCTSGMEYYVSVVGAEWIEREDRAEEDRIYGKMRVVNLQEERLM